ncbi:isoleucine--tRNA ligase, cytoplasmic-like [Centruroides sculpturatus]|uniref:isoleucine--tRNA ligase, cytoplasmic-like n=1 Tax=Centruroides sculpturatus TaxID=218467 RepID=UPI000C6ECF34|nr:isoleucine--tRNA ligase, cytoplasmic-like [Centruroides sculpturatus]
MGAAIEWLRNLAKSVKKQHRKAGTSVDTRFELTKREMVQPVPEYIEFPKEEEKVLQFWKDVDAFKTSLKLSKGRPRFTFYDGPPFATGLPHYGHILAGTIKDIVTRYAHQSGYHVERRFGWDCHGLPVEIVGRIGRWIDFDNDYKTLYPSFMESVWWVFKELYNKGLVYRGVKVMPYSTGCNTPLSNFESGQNYKEVIDPAVFVSFPIDGTEESLIAWTTTPWTLPSNLSVCVNPEMIYVKIRDNSVNKIYIMMEARLEALYKKPEEYTVLESFKGEVLKGKRYEPLFQYFSHLKEKGAFQVLCDSYVTEESGTGVVHQAPYFGEDDFRVCLNNGIISKDQEMICPIDANGRFIEPVSDFVGQYVKVSRTLAQKKKDIVSKFRIPVSGLSTIIRNCESVLKLSNDARSTGKCARTCIYMDADKAVLMLLINRVPDFVKEKRFANWLRDAHDWAISRNRYWGTPIPLWISEDQEEIVCVGSISELEKLSGQKVNDLHRETVDKLTIPSKMNKGVLRRISEVFDCWFESGSMPYAQVHYPFENKKEFEENFPADFIAEGVDQTRGWFYTLLVLSTALFGKPPFKNLISNGLVLASDGQKMSKRKKNYPDPVEIVNKYGADALRLYLINSPVVRAENLRFREEGVRDILKDVFLPWYNAYRFLVQNVELFEKEWNIQFRYDEISSTKSNNFMDQWILSFTQSLVLFVKKEMAAYKLYTVLPRLVKFVDHLTNWYVRMNRKRLKGEGGKEDCRMALDTLLVVLYTMIRMMAPFTPFLTELMYQNLRHLITENKLESNESVHYLNFPESQESLINIEVERKVSRMQAVIELGRLLRDRRTLPIKYPLPELIVINENQEYLDDVLSLQNYILEELNIRTLTVTTDKKKYGVRIKAEPDIKALGIRLRAASKVVVQAIRELNEEKLQEYLNGEELEVCGHKLEKGDIRISYSFSGDLADKLTESYEAHADENVLVLLNVNQDQSMVDEGVAREVINRIQKLRKKGHLVPSDSIEIFIKIEPSEHSLQTVVTSFKTFIENTLKAPLNFFPVPTTASVIIEETTMIKGASLEMVIIKREEVDSSVPAKVPRSEYNNVIGDTPNDIEKGPAVCRFVNVELCELKPQLGATNHRGTILLENPIGNFMLNGKELQKQVKTLFGLHGMKIGIYRNRDKQHEINNLSVEELLNLHMHTLYVFPQ